MGKVKKGKQRLDKFYHLAKETGYRSRAAFKLIQLDVKYRLLHTSRSVLDLCAAPGGWLQVAVARAPVGSFVLGVDLVPIRPIRGAHSIAEDITSSKCRSSIRKLMDANACAAFDLVLHDGSPNIGGAWASEATAQSSLVIDALRIATYFLSPKGTFVTKVFRSQDYNAIIYCLKELFEKVEVTKPAASRSSSAEIYVVGQKYKAPAKIDPRLLDVKHLFQGVVEPPKIVDVLRGSKQKRHREGYEDGNTTLRKVGKVSDFVWSDTPLKFLGSVNALSFENPESLSIKDHELTTEEVKSLCEDLGVLDRNSFKHLLRWQIRLRKALSSTTKISSGSDDVKVENVDDDDQLLNEIEELASVMDRKKKRAKKILAKRRAKDKARKELGMQIDATEDSYIDNELFSLASIKSRNQLQAVGSPELNDDVFRDSDSEEIQGIVSHNAASSEMDSDEEQKRYDKDLEEKLDEAYERYVTRKGGSAKQRKRAKRAFSAEDADPLEGHEDNEVNYSDQDSDPDEAAGDDNPLIVPLHDEVKPTQEQILEKWFNQDVFSTVGEGVHEKSDSEDEKEKKEVPMRQEKSSSFGKERVPLNSQSSQNEDFEIVPADPIITSHVESSEDNSSSDESDDEDVDTKAEILATAKKMIRKKLREEILEDAYNKYMFDDENLPKWFVEEERRHRQPIKPVTKEEVAAMRAQFREIDARPTRKVVEAKARKKKATMKRMEKVRQKANSISDQTEISERSKNKMINQLYKKATPKMPEKEYVVAKKGVRVKVGKGKVLVDRRMKKDARSRGAGTPGRKGSKKRQQQGKRNKGKSYKGFAKSSATKGGKGRKKGGKVAFNG